MGTIRKKEEMYFSLIFSIVSLFLCLVIIIAIITGRYIDLNRFLLYVVAFIILSYFGYVDYNKYLVLKKHLVK
jgi:hypothetical protein